MSNPRSCLCGWRAESPETHPHVAGCEWADIQRRLANIPYESEMELVQTIADLRAKLEEAEKDRDNAYRAHFKAGYAALAERLTQAEARVRRLEEARRAPFDDWKGVLKRKALDAARAALTRENPPEKPRS